MVYENATVEKALDRGVYCPGPGTALAEFINASECTVFKPIGYLGPSTLLSGMLYCPGPGIALTDPKVDLFALGILEGY